MVVFIETVQNVVLTMDLNFNKGILLRWVHGRDTSTVPWANQENKMLLASKLLKQPDKIPGHNLQGTGTLSRMGI